MSESNKPVISVRLLGDFKMLRGTLETDASLAYSPQISKMLAYLAMNRHQNISQRSLLDAIWQEEELDDPSNALRNLVFRARRICQPIALPDLPLLLPDKGAYRLSDAYEWRLDTEEINEIYAALKAKNTSADQTEVLYRRLLSLLGGMFMGGEASDFWMITAMVACHSVILDSVGICLRFLEAQKRDEETIELCRKGLIYDSMSEELHNGIVRCLVRQKKLQVARDYYEKIERILSKEYNVKASFTFAELVRQANG